MKDLPFSSEGAAIVENWQAGQRHDASAPLDGHCIGPAIVITGRSTEPDGPSGVLAPSGA
ncbi:MAG: hypothetical protein ACRDIC_15945 [bacterium]